MKINARKLCILTLLMFLIGLSLPIMSTASAQRYSWCSLNVSVNLPGAATVLPGSGSYYYGDYVVVQEFTNTGYSFDGWYLNGVYQGKLSSIPITMTQDYQLIAAFSKRVVCLTVIANPPEGGTLAPGMGSWNYTYGDTLTVREFPNSGYTLSGWYLDGSYQGAGTAMNITMDQDHQVSAFFAGSGDGSTPTPTATPAPTPEPTPDPSLRSPNLRFYCTSSTTSSGFHVNIEGTLEYAGSGLSGAGLQFSYSVTGGATWQDLAYLFTGDGGNFSAVWMPSASGYCIIKATYAGDNIYARTYQLVNFAVAPSDDEQQDMFSVTSNSTLTSLVFDSTKNELAFGVSGTSGTSGYIQVCIPQSLVSDVSNLVVTMDNQQISYNAFARNDIWILTVFYHHSEHKLVVALNAEASSPSASSPSGSDSANLFGNQFIFVAIIAILIAVIAALIILNRRKPKSTT